MGILFGLAVLALLLAGLFYQRRQKKSWVAEERYDESGVWIDKRSSERGTYGALDAEREQERKAIARQGRINELTRLLRDYCFEEYPGFDKLTDAQIKTFTNFTRAQTVQLFERIESLESSQKPELLPAPNSDSPHIRALKKITLEFSYDQFPKLLDQDIALLKAFDQHAAGMAAVLLGELKSDK